MARGAFAVLGGLMFGLCFFEEIIVAAEANLPLTASHFHRESRLVTGAAFLLFIGWMRMKLDLHYGGGRIGLNRAGRSIQRPAVFIIDNGRGVCAVARLHPIKKERQPLLLFLGRTARENRQPQAHRHASL